jgi:hypothetical protein
MAGGNAYGGWGSLAGTQDSLDPTFNEVENEK